MALVAGPYRSTGSSTPCRNACSSGQRTLGHPRDERGGHAGIDGVAAFGQEARACLRSQGVPGGDRAFHDPRLARGAQRLKEEARRLEWILVTALALLRRTTTAAALPDPGCDDRDPDLAGEARIDGGAEDDVRLLHRGPADDFGRLVDFHQ